MKYQITQIPQYIPRQDYMDLVDRIVSQFSEMPEVDSIYQVGSIKNPGISDLDIIVVFKDNEAVKLNYRASISEYEKQILTHGLFGTSVSLFQESMTYSVFSNYNKLYSSKKSSLDKMPALRISAENKIQIAMEYLLRMWITLVVQKSFMVFKLRSLLLEIKALSYDLELLGVKGGKLYEMVNEIIDLRNQWFRQSWGPDRICIWLESFIRVLREELQGYFKKFRFVIPYDHFKIARNIIIREGNELEYKVKGVSQLSHFYNILGSKYFSLMNRLNTFQFYVPSEIVLPRSSQYKRFCYLHKHLIYNKMYLPHFGILGTSLRMDDGLLRMETSRPKVPPSF